VPSVCCLYEYDCIVFMLAKEDIFCLADKIPIVVYLKVHARLSENLVFALTRVGHAGNWELVYAKNSRSNTCRNRRGYPYIP
jgi:hypothetical protein